MKIEVEVYDIPKDKDGFWDEQNDTMFDSLPILVFNEYNGWGEIIDKDNWGDWLDYFNISMYKHYIKIKEIRL